MRQIAEQVYAQKATQYGVSQVGVHTHNGFDTVKIKFPDLENASSYRAIARVTLSAAEVKALNSSPLEIIPSQGDGSVIIVEGAEGYLHYKSAQYTGTNDIQFRYRDTIQAQCVFPWSYTWLNLAQSAYIHSAGDGLEYLEMDAGGSVEMYVGTANPAAGNSPVTVQLTYRVVTLANQPA